MECRFCNRSFAKGEHLKRHERRHTGLKPFVCSTCQRSFNRQDSLLRHQKLHGPNTVQPTLPASPPELESSNLRIDDSSGESHEPSTSALEDSPLTEIFGDQSSSLTIDFDASLIFPDSEELFQTLTLNNVNDYYPFPTTPPICPSGCENPEKLQAPGGLRRIHEQERSIEDIPQGANQRAIRDVGQMVSFQSASVMTAIDPTTTNSMFLDECLHMFFIKFVPTLPLLHRATFIFRDCIHPLLLNAIAIGSLYLGPKSAISKGEALWKLAHAAMVTNWESLISHRGPYDSSSGIQLILTAVFGQMYGSLSRNRAIRRTSQAFRTLGLFWARQCGLLNDAKPIALPKSTDPVAEQDHKWRLWAAGEVRQRAVLALFMLDRLVANMTGDPFTHDHMKNQLRISCDDTAFFAESSEAWLRAVQQSQEQPSYCSVLRSLFEPAADLYWHGPVCSFFSLRILLEGVQSNKVTDGTEESIDLPVKPETHNALARILDGIRNSKSVSEIERMELLLRWHSICLETSTNVILLASTICTRYGVKQDMWSSCETRDDLQISSFPNTPSGRRSALHAVAIQDLVEGLPRGRAHALYMPMALFSAAIIYATFALAGLFSTKLPGSVNWVHVCIDPDSAESDTLNYVRGNMDRFTGSQRNLLYDLNSMQKLFRCLATQWGIAYDMEAIVDQLLSKRTQSAVRLRG